jgi:hypothetical protein
MVKLTVMSAMAGIFSFQRGGADSAKVKGEYLRE